MTTWVEAKPPFTEAQKPLLGHMCHCGHECEQHTWEEPREIDSHAPCGVEGCDCREYHFKNWVLPGGDPPASQASGTV